MNKMALSMMICITLVGVTLLSLGLSYRTYQSNLSDIDKKWAELEKKEEIAQVEAEKQEEKKYQLELAEYEAELQKREEEERQAKENGELYYKSRIIVPPTNIPEYPHFDSYYYDLESQREELHNDFNHKIIIHTIIIGFILISELGILLVLPKRKKSIDITIK